MSDVEQEKALKAYKDAKAQAEKDAKGLKTDFEEALR